MKKLKSTKAITLIALVITIVILVILAGISISALTQIGLLKKANKAKTLSRYSEAKETINLKLMEIETNCYSINKEYNIKEIATGMKDADNIMIEKYYNSETANIKNGITENIINLNGVVVSVNDYNEYKFLIGKDGKIEGVTTNNVDSMAQEDFETIENFEKNIGNISKNEEVNEELEIKITDINQDGYTVNVINNYPENMNVKYEYYIDNTKMTDKVKDKTYVINDSFSEHRICVVAYSGDAVLKSKDIIFEAPYKIAPILNSNTESIINKGFLEDTTNQWGHFTLYNAFDNNEATLASTEQTGDSAIGSYIGYDFEKEVEVARVTGKIRMREYIIQYSDDKKNWNDAIVETSYSSNYGDNFDNNINSNIGKHRFWRLYVKNGCSVYNWGACVWNLHFYIKEDSVKKYIGNVPYLNENTKEIINDGFDEKSESEWGKVTLYNAFSFENSNSKYACPIKTGDGAIGSSIGYDFGKKIEVSRVVGKIRMREYVIQYSDDKEKWNDAINGKSNESQYGDKIDDVIDTKIGKHRYWRLYVKNGCSNSNWGAIVYSLQFYSVE